MGLTYEGLLYLRLDDVRTRFFSKKRYDQGLDIDFEFNLN